MNPESHSGSRISLSASHGPAVTHYRCTRSSTSWTPTDPRHGDVPGTQHRPPALLPLANPVTDAEVTLA